MRMLTEKFLNFADNVNWEVGVAAMKLQYSLHHLSIPVQLLSHLSGRTQKTYALQVLERVGCCELLGLEQVVLGDIEVALRLLNAIVAEFDTVSTVLYLILQMGAFQWLANGTPPAASFLDLAQLRKLRAELTYVFLSDHTRLHDGGAVVCFVGHFAK